MLPVLPVVPLRADLLNQLSRDAFASLLDLHRGEKFMIKKKIISLLLAAGIMSAFALVGCSGNNNDTQSDTASSADGSAASTGTTPLPEDGGFKTVSYEASKDKYRTFYEIFPYAFYDSDDDGIGDLNGITSKLDYLNDGDTSTTDDLGIEGIWLMPIMPSPSYHKYNVSDYKNIDPAYGTLDDFKKLVDESHKRNINVIIDFVINHSSRQHEWYQNAIKELKEGKTDGYAQYYHFKENNDQAGWQKAGVGNWYYECQFDADMPDLNLTNEKLREEIKDIVKFWLDMGVDGFRLDAVLWYESTGNDDSISDLKWLYDYAKSVKDDVYMVGECWDSAATISQYYKSGVDSFFDFDSQGASGRVMSAVSGESAQSYVKALVSYEEMIRKNNENAINSTFISNHDTGRSAGFLTTITSQEMAAAMYILSPGNAFIYYGEEIGMIGSETDPDKRTGMYWSETDTKGYVKKIPGASNKSVPDAAVDEQLKDDKSLLSFYKRVIALKNQNPEIARGSLTAVYFDNSEVAGYVCDNDGSKVLVIFNAGEKGETITVPEDTFKVNEVRGYVVAAREEDNAGGGAAALDALLGGGSSEESTEEEDEITEFSVSGQGITLPPYSAIVLK